MKSLLLTLLCFAPVAAASEPLCDWSDWKKYRAAVNHPSLVVKHADLRRAAENVARYPWARQYVAALRRNADRHVERLTTDVIEQMLEVTTPLSPIFTPCPACRDQGRTWHPHGQWEWSFDAPQELSCRVCKTVFPHEKYPETIELKSSWGTPQTFSFVGGEPFVVFGYKHGRPSMSGNIRSRKVGHVTAATGELTEAFLLTGEEKYAATIRLILLRLADVYPHWLVRTAYGEFADCDPRTAAANISALPSDELVYPPNKPDRALHTGFWTAGRATGTGQEGHFVRTVAMAYDATCTLPIYSDAERLKIEEKLLLESTILLVADKKINNKSVGNRTAAAMVGLVVGHPGLVHFGVEGFHKTVDEWFLPDGGTSESPSYALMTFNNTLDMPLAVRGYSDPPGYRDPFTGERLDNVDLFRQTRYEQAWSAMINGLQGDCTFVPYADAYANRKISSHWVDLLVWQYPDRGQYLALLKELSGEDLRHAVARHAIYWREPGLEDKPAPPLAFEDFCPPALRIGHMRTGARAGDGRESLLVLSASHWGVHHHLDSLNLYYWKDGQELLSDLGYLWDNPKKKMTARTLAHNTVLIDEQDQLSKERGGEVHFFKTSPHVKTMRASSKAYAQARRYERTVALIDHGEGRSYVADFFLVEGGQTQDYVFHGPNQTFSADVSSAAEIELYDLTNVRRLSGGRIDWDMAGKQQFTAWLPPQRDEQTHIADGWGQRDSYNRDEGATLPYIIRRTRGDGAKLFTSVFTAHAPGEPFVKSVKRIERGKVIALEVETTLGTDYIECHAGGLKVTAKSGGRIRWTFIQR